MRGYTSIPAFQDSAHFRSVGDPGSYTFSGQQLDTLLKWYEDGHRTLRRDHTEDKPGLRGIGINNQSSLVFQLMKEAGIVEVDGTGVKRITEHGHWWLKAY